MIDVCVRDHNLLHLQIVLLDDRHNLLDVVSRIDDEGLVGCGVANNRAVALQGAYGQDLVNHANILPGREYCEAVGLPQLEIKKVLDGWRTLAAEGLRNRTDSTSAREAVTQALVLQAGLVWPASTEWESTSR